MFDREERAAKAREYFTSGYNCAQSVAMAFADVIALDEMQVAAVASGFGGGFARMREVCGCVSGMTLVAGAACPATNPSDMACRTRNYALVQRLAGRFKALQGSIICRELLGIRASNAAPSPVPSDRTPQYYHSRACADYIACAASILASELNDLEASGIPSWFAAGGVTYRTLECVNWPGAFPYKPSVMFAAKVEGETLYVHYKVCEDVTAAAAAEDGGRVWEDSCAELFIAFDEGGYYNIECSCIGKLVFGFGPDRHDRAAAPAGVLAGIGRWTTAGTQPFAETHLDSWEAALAIPLKSFYRHSEVNFSKAKVNVYKCGDKLSKPHFLSLFPIETPAPDFHRPEFFKPL